MGLQQVLEDAPRNSYHTTWRDGRGLSSLSDHRDAMSLDKIMGYGHDMIVTLQAQLRPRVPLGSTNPVAPSTTTLTEEGAAVPSRVQPSTPYAVILQACIPLSRADSSVFLPGRRGGRRMHLIVYTQKLSFPLFRQGASNSIRIMPSERDSTKDHPEQRQGLTWPLLCFDPRERGISSWVVVRNSLSPKTSTLYTKRRDMVHRPPSPCADRGTCTS